MNQHQSHRRRWGCLRHIVCPVGSLGGLFRNCALVGILLYPISWIVARLNQDALKARGDRFSAEFLLREDVLEFVESAAACPFIVGIIGLIILYGHKGKWLQERKMVDSILSWWILPMAVLHLVRLAYAPVCAWNAYDVSRPFAVVSANIEAWRTFFLIAGICSAISVFWITARSHRRFLRLEAAGAHCQGCGYDLTGNESGRCPECGSQLDYATRRRIRRSREGLDGRAAYRDNL